MITIHRLEAPGAYRTVWLLEELQLTYQIGHVSQDNPNANLFSRSQVALTDGSETIVGAYAIADYLLSRYDRMGLRPPMASAQYTLYQQWINHIEADLIPLFNLYTQSEKLANSRVPFFARSILKKAVTTALSNPSAADIEQSLQHIERNLNEHGWTCGSYFTAADIQLSYVLEQAKAKGMINETSFPNIYYFLEAINNRPAYKTTKEKIGNTSSEVIQSDTPLELTDDNTTKATGDDELDESDD
ncbi:hypothetical protein V757_11400 [Pelistega indica]|uniref:GST C-terminal domain-containing protein n=1 Tax=Pelistega indica TaxID=1414851 RepID=V8FU68_9BURK|nr:glutathione S-transferase family protein [Pelistega indica]ETD67426.1 hypothetical protein V757_11400 [Pelistega indica]